MDRKHKRPLPKIVLPDGTVYQKNRWRFQQAFKDLDDKFACLGGAIGAGKTLAMLEKVLEELWGYPSNFGLILRKDLPRLRNTALRDLLEVMPKGMLIDYNKNDSTFEILNAYGYEKVVSRKQYRGLSKRKLKEKLESVHGISKLVFTSFEGTTQALSKFRSQNLGFFCIEQAEEASIEIYDILIERLRKKPSGRRAFFVSNPQGHDWIWRIFHPESPDKRKNHTMIIGNTRDNKSLAPDYYETLEEVYTEDQQKRLLYSSWDVAPMAYFPEFSGKHHIIPHIEPGDTWEKGLGLDHGINHPTSVIFAAWTPTGEVYVYDEYSVTEKIVSDHAQEIMPKITDEHRTFMIDPSTNQRHGTGPTVRNQYRALGIPFQNSSRDVNAGITRIKEYMKFDERRRNPWTGETGSARLFISERCINLIRGLMDYQKEEQKSGIGHVDPPDKPRKYKDDEVDALRYLLMGFVEPLTTASHATDAPKVTRKLPNQAQQATKNPHLRINKELDDPADRFGNAVEMSIEEMVKEAGKHPVRRTTWRKVNGIAVSSKRA